MAIISIPVPLRKLTQGHDTWQLSWASNIEECILELEEAWPGIRERIVNEDGKIRQFVNIYLNGEDVRFAQAEKTVVNSDDEISIVPAIAGG